MISSPNSLLNAYSPKEEKANILTHTTGLVLSVAGFFLLILCSVIRELPWKQTASFAIFGFSMILLYGASVLYHKSTCERNRRKLKILDHAAIYLLIAGSYTPFMIVSLNSKLGANLFFTIWFLAITGVVFKIYFAGRFKLLSTAIYLFMGWLCMFAIDPLIASLSRWGMTWLVGGGLFYSFGTLFYLNKRIPYNHAIWHLFVLAGSICHFISISMLLFY